MKALRDRTGAAMMDCKSALAEADGDVDRAIEILRVKGQASAAKREGRGTERGRRRLLHPRQRQGRGDGRSPVRDRLRRPQRGLQGVRLRGRPARRRDGARSYVSSEEIPEEEREAEQRVFEEKAREEGKPDDVVEKIVEGQLAKWAQEVALLDQTHVNAEKHDSKTIEELRQELAAKTGENIRIARFAYFRVGRGVGSRLMAAGPSSAASC